MPENWSKRSPWDHASLYLKIIQKSRTLPLYASLAQNGWIFLRLKTSFKITAAFFLFLRFCCKSLFLWILNDLNMASNIVDGEYYIGKENMKTTWTAKIDWWKCIVDLFFLYNFLSMTNWLSDQSLKRSWYELSSIGYIIKITLKVNWKGSTTVRVYFQPEIFLGASDICDCIPNKSAREFYIGFHLICNIKTHVYHFKM